MGWPKKNWAEHRSVKKEMWWVREDEMRERGNGDWEERA
jgi:hypothetical protein